MKDEGTEPVVNPCTLLMCFLKLVAFTDDLQIAHFTKWSRGRDAVAICALEFRFRFDGATVSIIVVRRGFSFDV